MMHAQLELWIQEIRRYNPRLHLVGPRLLESLEEQVQACQSLLADVHEPVLADIGSGSGLPAIPYAILHPAAEVTLIERSRKKCLFLRHVVDLLGLTQVSVLEIDPLAADMRAFPAVLARAFSPQAALCTVVRRILEPGGRLYAMGTVPPVLDADFRLQRTAEYAGLGLYGYEFIPE